jgi:hypothetical protein
VPVLTITPSPVDLRSLNLIGQSVLLPLTITNHGLVAARDLSFTAPVHLNYAIELLDSLSGINIPAQESLLVNLYVERIADDPNAPCSIDLGQLFWDYGTSVWKVASRVIR